MPLKEADPTGGLVWKDPKHGGRVKKGRKKDSRGEGVYSLLEEHVFMGIGTVWDGRARVSLEKSRKRHKVVRL